MSKRDRADSAEGAHRDGDAAVKIARKEGNAHSTKEMLRTTVAQGPFSVLDSAMKENVRVFVQCRFNKSLLATVVAFDKHFNLVLQDVIELTAREKEEQKPRSIRNLFLRGESVIFIVKMAPEGDNK